MFDYAGPLAQACARSAAPIIPHRKDTILGLALVAWRLIFAFTSVELTAHAFGRFKTMEQVAIWRKALGIIKAKRAAT